MVPCKGILQSGGPAGAKCQYVADVLAFQEKPSQIDVLAIELSMISQIRGLLTLAVLVLGTWGSRQAFARGRQPIKIVNVSDSRSGLTFAVPAGWKSQVDSTYQVVARGKDGGLSTHVVVKATPAKAVHDFFIWPEEAGDIHADGGPWTCAASRSWRANLKMNVVVCGEQLRNGHVLMVVIVADKDWLNRAGGEAFLRSLVVSFRGFRAEDD